MLVALFLGLIVSPCLESTPMTHSSRLDTRVLRVLAGKPLATPRRPSEERGVEGAFESDMRLTRLQLLEIVHQQLQMKQEARGVASSRTRRKAVASNTYLWPSKIVPYVFDNDFPEHFRSTAMEAMRFWQRNTCLQFVPFSDGLVQHLGHDDHVVFKVGKGCQSSIGRVRMGKQTTEIGDNCNEFGSVAHELGHVLGFYHEHSRPDRDNYVTVLRFNIRSDRQYNFLKYSNTEILTSEPYDIGSVMHYGPTYFSKDGESRTIDTEDESLRAVMGQRHVPSFIDVKTANDLYSCAQDCRVWPECDNTGYVGPDCTCVCPTGLGGWNCREVKPSTADCGGVLNDSYGVIESPGYGTGYTNGVDCLWLIQGPGDASVVLTFHYFELEDDRVQPCAFDWLEVRTLGPHLNGQRFCGKGPSEDIRYPGNALVLHFHSDESYQFDGFQLSYTVVERP
ncbi:blastula protease 10-like isoform X1 [Pomacea canaliculata]|uniref:blastula protease 10-like isoform X1 n=1 Tax=Pomacea canaliculata TaxID=400727 RepID=UPI000D73CF4A|nr:blastula protease 10-like isoform X1 [Pomacea canaliculata]